MAFQHLRSTSHILESSLEARGQLVAESASRSPYTLTAWDSVEDFCEASTINSLSQPFTDTWTYYAGTPTNLYYLSHEESHPRDGVVISGTSIEEMASLLLVAQHTIFGRHIRSFVPPPPPPSLSFLSSPSQRTFRTLCAPPIIQVISSLKDL